MTNPGNEDPFDAFLHDATKSEAYRHQYELETELWSYELIDGLDTHGAQYVWHPDKEQRGENTRQAVSNLVTMGYNADEAEDKVLERFVIESSIVTQLFMARGATQTLIGAVGEAEHMPVLETMKKELLVRVHEDSKFGQAWYEAAGEFLGNVQIDFTAGEHISISAELIEKDIEYANRLRPIAEKVGHILLNESVSPNDTARLGMLSHLVTAYVNRVRRSLLNRANAEEYLQSLVVKGDITTEQLTQLRELFNESDT